MTSLTLLITGLPLRSIRSNIVVFFFLLQLQPLFSASPPPPKKLASLCNATLDPNSGAGHVVTLGGLPTYVIGSPHSKLAIILASDVYGYSARNLRKLADKVAASGFFVAVPDFVKGEPFNRSNPSRPMDAWLKDHSTDEGFKNAKLVIQDLKSKGFCTIGATGICWGGKIVTELSKGNFIKAGALLHPSYVTVDDMKEVKVPLAILGAESDSLAPPKLVKQFEKILDGKPEIDHFVKIFLGVGHGWTVRYCVNDEESRKRAEEAHQDLIHWLTKHIK